MKSFLGSTALLSCGKSYQCVGEKKKIWTKYNYIIESEKC